MSNKQQLVCKICGRTTTDQGFVDDRWVMGNYSLFCPKCNAELLRNKNVLSEQRTKYPLLDDHPKIIIRRMHDRVSPVHYNIEDLAIAEKISQRRRQVLVHSVIYYRMNENIVPDYKWNEWAMELYELQKQYPEIAATCPLADIFRNFHPSSGHYLPLENPWANNKALQLLAYKNRQ